MKQQFVLEVKLVRKAVLAFSVEKPWFESSQKKALVAAGWEMNRE